MKNEVNVQTTAKLRNSMTVFCPVKGGVSSQTDTQLFKDCLKQSHLSLNMLYMSVRDY